MAKRSLEQRRADNLRKAGVDPVTKRPRSRQGGDPNPDFGKMDKNLLTKVPTARKGEGRTTPSGKVAAQQRAQAATDSPLKNTTQKKPPSTKNDAESMSDRELVAAYRKSSSENEVGVNFFLAKEAERRGLRDPKTRDLTAEAQRLETPGSTVARQQRKQAVKDSPLKPTTTKKPPVSKTATDPNARRRSKTTGMVPKSQPGGPTSVDRKSTLQNVTKKSSVPGARSARKLSMDPKQVARRAKRGFPNGR